MLAPPSGPNWGVGGVNAELVRLRTSDLTAAPGAAPLSISVEQGRGGGGAARTGHAGSRGTRRFMTLFRSEFHLERREVAS